MTLRETPPLPPEFTENRRHHPRTDFSGPVLVDSTAAWCQAEGVDVSAGGMRLKSDRPLPLGTTVEVYFELGALAVETRAHVVRSFGDIICLSFDQRRQVSHTPPHGGSKSIARVERNSLGKVLQ